MDEAGSIGRPVPVVNRSAQCDGAKSQCALSCLKCVDMAQTVQMGLNACDMGHESTQQLGEGAFSAPSPCLIVLTPTVVTAPVPYLFLSGQVVDEGRPVRLASCR